jgi:hypothetical protein
MHFFLVTRLPTAAMNPDDDRKALALVRGVNIERLALVLRVGVGQAKVGLRLVGRDRGGETEDEEERGDTHGSLPRVLVYSP